MVRLPGTSFFFVFNCGHTAYGKLSHQSQFSQSSSSCKRRGTENNFKIAECLKKRNETSFYVPVDETESGGGDESREGIRQESIDPSGFH